MIFSLSLVRDVKSDLLFPFLIETGDITFAELAKWT